MNIFLVRHGEAEPIGLRLNDSERNLTESGKESLVKAAEGWQKLIPGFDCIVSSPLKRAVQTAEIIKAVYHFEKDIIIDKSVVSGKSSQILEMANVMKCNNILFCGHEPDFSRYVSELISVNGAAINFKKGMIAKISFEGKARLGAGYLEFLIPVKAYR